MMFLRISGKNIASHTCVFYSITNGLHESMDKPPDLPQFKSEMTCKNTAQTMSPCKVADTRTKYNRTITSSESSF